MNKCLVLMAFAICGIVATSCSQGPPEAKVPPAKVDLATPDKALKSYWAVRDENRLRTQGTVTKFQDELEAQAKRLGEVAVPAVAIKHALSAVETFSRDILELKVESDSRAVAVANIKNTTPIPSGAEPSRYNEEKRRDGDRYRYVLEKGQPGWQVAEVWRWDTYPSPGGFKKFLPSDGKPLVPTETYGGY